MGGGYLLYGGPETGAVAKVLAVGVSVYGDPSLKLRFPGKDAEDMAKALKKFPRYKLD